MLKAEKMVVWTLLMLAALSSQAQVKPSGAVAQSAHAGRSQATGPGSTACAPAKSDQPLPSGSPGTRSSQEPVPDGAPCVDSAVQSGSAPADASITSGTDGTSGIESRPADPQGTTPGTSAGGETLRKDRPAGSP